MPISPPLSLRAAYVFVLLGRNSCSPKHAATMLAAVAMLRESSPAYPIVSMLSSACWRSRALSRALSAIGVQQSPLGVVDNVSCGGPQAQNGYFGETYDILSIWGHSEWDALLYLDNDVAVVSPMDTILERLRDSPATESIS